MPTVVVAVCDEMDLYYSFGGDFFVIPALMHVSKIMDIGLDVPVFARLNQTVWNRILKHITGGVFSLAAVEKFLITLP